MKIKRLKVKGFRTLLDFEIHFSNGLTIIVGENDSGKTSLMDCLKVITQNRPVTIDDISYGEEECSISMEVDDFICRKIYKRIDGNIKQVSSEISLSESFIKDTKEVLNAENFNVSIPENKDYLKGKAYILGLLVRSNTNFSNLKNRVIQKLNDYSNQVASISSTNFPAFNNIYLDSRQFENISTFFTEIFIKEKESNMWQDFVEEGVTLENFIQKKLNALSNEISATLQEHKILEKMKMFLEELTDIKINLTFQPQGTVVTPQVVFIENNREINVDKKGDGTKRRITMALLEFKKDQSLINNSQTIYLLDEPDTHLHVKAQMHLVDTLKDLERSENQVILTTHSPFILNSVKPSQVRALKRDQNSTIVSSISNVDQNSKIISIIKDLGVENTDLFFSRKIIIVEGATEKNFIESHYKARTQSTLSSGLIKVIDIEGINNIPGFTRAILEFHKVTAIFLLYDNDASEEMKRLIQELKFLENHKFGIGDREFEDAFSSSILHQCWIKYNEELNHRLPPNWQLNKIDELKCQCKKDSSKFSKKLSSLNEGGTRMTKPLLGHALGTYIDANEVPDPINKLFTYLLET